MSLDELRKRIDELDADLLRLLNRRAELALEIGRLKSGAGREIFDPVRESHVLQNVLSLNPGPLTAEALEHVYREIMSAARSLEREMCVAYLGPSATFTHQAAHLRFGGSVKYLDCDTITDVFSDVQKGRADYGVVPIENSIEGAVTHTLDEFIETPLRICAEIYMPISQHLMAKIPREDIQRIYSKAEVFGQCRRWLHENMPRAQLIPASSTAKAAETAGKEPHSAAIASQLAAEIHGLTVLESDVQDHVSNTTRFLVLGRSYGGPSGNDKTSILFAVRHQAGALFTALESFRTYEINMTKIESRPSRAKAWEYYFFVDVEGHAEDAKVKKALQDLGGHCLFMTVLGSYPRASSTPVGE